MKTVTRKEFDQFIEAYEKRIGRKLEAQLQTICMPEQIHYFDRDLGNWPEFVVAARTPANEFAGKEYPEECRVREDLE